MGDDGSQFSSSDRVPDTEDNEVQSPREQQTSGQQSGLLPEEGTKKGTEPSKHLVMQDDEQDQAQLRKRKSKGLGASQTPDLNIPFDGSSAIALSGLVSSRVNRGGSIIETLKKQKRGNTTPNARSAAAARDSPRWAQ
jgi:hypothetical protein